jgi:uncharacterized protein (TIGR03790 family)
VTDVSRVVRRISLCLLVLAWLPCIARANLQADELLLIVNKNIPASIKSAEFYAKARLVPDGRILALSLPASEEIPFDKYEQEIVPAVRDFLRTNHLETKVKCAVTFFGVPFRIAGKPHVDADQIEGVYLKQDLDAVAKKALAPVAQIEGVAQDLNPDFKPLSKGEGPQELMARANFALLDINKHLPPADDPQHAKLFTRLVELMRQFGGDALLAARVPDAELTQLLPDDQAKAWPARRKEIEANLRQIEALSEKRWDAEARKKVRELTASTSGLFGQLGIIHSQQKYVDSDGTAAAFDNELALLWWNYYPRSSYLPNPLHYRSPLGTEHPPVLMVSRLDGPQEGTAMQIILGSLKAERDGLKGKFVIDSTGGTGPGGVPDKAGGYRKFDQHLIELADLVRTKTKIPVTLDRRSEVIPPRSVKDVALYCGWYSVRNYVPSCSFVAGAVGFHVASFEMISLRTDNEKGWVAGLLNDGIAATMGAVAEPYLAAFPYPDEFFPLLLTGKLTLAEVYWKTCPMVSWMMTCVGDPLYTPFKTNPQMKVEDLPGALKQAL